LMKQAAEQEARRLAEEAVKKKAEEEAKRVAEEKWKAKEQAKKAAEEKVRADFEARRKAEAEVRAREKAESLAAGEEMRARLGTKPKVRGRVILFFCLLLTYCLISLIRSLPVPTRASWGSDPLVTDAGKVATATGANWPTVRAHQLAVGVNAQR